MQKSCNGCFLLRCISSAVSLSEALKIPIQDVRLNLLLGTRDKIHCPILVEDRYVLIDFQSVAQFLSVNFYYSCCSGHSSARVVLADSFVNILGLMSSTYLQQIRRICMHIRINRTALDVTNSTYTTFIKIQPSPFLNNFSIFLRHIIWYIIITCIGSRLFQKRSSYNLKSHPYFTSKFILVMLKILRHILWLQKKLYQSAVVIHFIADTCGPIIS